MKIDSVHAEFMSGNAVSSTSSSHSIVSRDASGDIAVAGVSIAGNSGTLFSYSDGTRSVYGGCDANNPWFGTSSDNDLRLVTNGSEQMRIDNTGNVGIGTSSPLTKLNMKDGVFLAENQASTNDQILYGDGGGTGADNNSYTIANAKFGTGVFVNDTGTTGSTITLVNKEGANNTTKHASIGFVTTDTTFNGKFGGQIGFWPEDANSSKMQFRIYTSGAQAGYNLPVQRMVVNGDGNVGIGVASPGFPLDVVFSGDSGIRSKSTNSHATLNLDSGSGYGYIRFQDSGSETVWLQSKPTGDVVIRPQGGSETVVFGANGNVGIGTTSPDLELHVHDANAADSGIILSSTSGYHRLYDSGGQFYIQSGTAASSDSRADINFTSMYDATSYMKILGSNGNVGINDTSPSYKLSVNGSFRVHGNIATFGSDGLLHINSRSTTYGSETVALQTTIDGRALTESNPGTHGGESRNVLALQPDGGYVGIGLSNPGYKLHVDGSSMFTNTVNIINNDASAYASLEMGGTVGAYIDLKSPSSDDYDFRLITTGSGGSIQVAGGGDAMTFDSSGNVGIGTTDPTRNLHVHNGSGHCWVQIESSASGGDAELLLKSLTGEWSIWNNGSDDSLRFYRGSDRVVFDGNGNCGIGTAIPYAKLHIHGSAGYLAESNGSTLRFAYDLFPTRNSSSSYWADAMSIYATDDIASGGHILSSQGIISSSDERIKKNIVDADDAECLETLRLLKPKKYQYKDIFKKGEEPVWGFIAQEVRETLPHATQMRRDVIPNIYELANVSSSNVITFTNFNTSNLEANATTLIRVTGIDDENRDIHLAEVIDEHTVRVEEDLSEWIGSVDESGNVVAGNHLFVHGQEVDDFVYLKKESIFTVATAALQEVDRQQQTDKARISELESRNDALESRNDALESRVEELEAMVSIIKLNMTWPDA